MPTGYTATLCEGEQSFSEFVLGCARAFGACIEQRDAPLNELPRGRTKSTHHETQLASSIALLNGLEAMSEEERIALGERSRKEDIESAQESIKKRTDVRDRLQAMIDRVRAWSPPTHDHEALKKFMLQQLDDTIKHDGDVAYYEKELARAQAATPISYYESQVEGAKWSVKYHQKNLYKEEESVEASNKWVNDLYQSVADSDLSWKLLQQSEK